jgi:hypothetical protein
MKSLLGPVTLLGVTVGLVACTTDSGGTGGSAGAPAKGGNAGSNSRAGAGGTASGAAGKSMGGGGSAGASAGTGGVPAAGRAGAGGSAGVGGSAGTPTSGRGGAAGSSGTAGRGALGGGGGEAGDEPSGGGSSGAGGGSEEIPPGYVKAIVGVGYGGIRILSRDGGNTWTERAFAAPDGGDDEDLLRAVAYGKGRWIATGWKLMTSDDGVHWTDRGMLNDGIIDQNPIIEGLAYKDGYFFAAGDGSSGAHIYRSADGLTWSSFGTGGDTVKHTGLTYRAGLFVSYGDSGTSYQSSDAKTWTEMGIDDATYCEQAWRTFSQCHEAWWSDDGYYILPEWGGLIRRSTTGSSFKTVYTDDQQNTFYQARAVAEGYVAPE